MAVVSERAAICGPPRVAGSVAIGAEATPLEPRVERQAERDDEGVEARAG